MKTIFKLFALEECTFLSSGALPEEYNIVIRHFVSDFDSEIDAINFIANEYVTETEHGFEIVKTFHKTF